MTHPTRRNALKTICAAVAAAMSPVVAHAVRQASAPVIDGDWDYPAKSTPIGDIYGPEVERLGRVTAWDPKRDYRVKVYLNGHDYSNVGVDGDDRAGWVDCLLWEGFPNPPQPGRQLIGVNRWAALNASCEYWQPDGFPFMPEPGYKGRAYGGYVWEDERGRPHAMIYGPWVFVRMPK